MGHFFEKIEGKRIQCLLISRLRFMGDVILTTPLIRALKKGLPDVRLVYLTEPPFGQLLENNPYLDKIVLFDRVRLDSLPVLKSFREQVQFFSALRKLRCTAAVDLLGLPRTAFQLRLSGAPIRIGGNYRYRKHLYTHLFPVERMHWKTAIDFYLNVLKFFDLPDDGRQTKVFVTEKEKGWARAYLKMKGFDLSLPIVGLHPGGTWPAKLWPWERFAELAVRLTNELKVQVFLTGGPNDQEILKKVGEKLGDRAYRGEVLTLRQLAAVQSLFSVFVSNDCGPMHLAPAVGTPTIGIFGPGEPDIWFPYSEEKGHSFIYKHVSCSPCHYDFCPTDHICMKAIEVEEVFERIRKVLERFPVRSKY